MIINNKKLEAKTFDLAECKPKVLLLGNGLSRAYNAGSWDHFLDSINRKKDEFPEPNKINMPMPLKIILLTDNHVGSAMKDNKQYFLKGFYDELDKDICEQIRKLFDCGFDYILTTNYSYELEYTVYGDNPVLKKIGQLIIWQQDKVSFTISGKQCITVDGKKYKLTTSDIIVAHPMEMKAEDISGWQEYLKEKGYKQPFIQIWEPVYDKKTIAPDRYKGAMIPYYCFLKQEKHGIEVKDYDYHNDIEINLKGCQATIERIDWRRHEIAVDDRFMIASFGFKTYSRQVNHLVAYFDRVTAFERVKQDDISIMNAVPNFNIEQIMSLITTAQKENAVKVLAALLEYKNNNYAEYITIDSLTLDL